MPRAPLTDEQKQKLWAGRAAYHAARKLAKAQMPKGAEKRAIEAQGGDPDPSPLEEFKKTYRQKKQKLPPVVTFPQQPLNFEAMTLEELRQWVTDTKKNWDEAILALRSKEAQYAVDHTSVPCACGCGLLVDLTHGRFASSEAYYDQNRVVKVRYWATQRCVQAYRLAQSPEYKAQIQRELEERAKRKEVMPAVPRVLEA